MKRNLFMSIALLFLAVITCCGVTFAYFSSTQTGSDNYIKLGDFTFENTNTKQQQNGTYTFNAPTIINVPSAITKPVAPTLPIKETAETSEAFAIRMAAYNAEYATYTTNYATFLKEGDDEYFNSYVIPITITVKNNSLADMQLSIKLVASNGGSGADYTFNGGVQYFLFSSTPQGADYATSIRTSCASISSTQTDNFEKTKDVLAQGIANFNKNTINNSILYGKNKTANGTIKTPESPNSVTYLAVCWLDYRQYKQTLNPTGTGSSARPEGKVKINIEVTASQYPQGAAQP